MNAAVRAAERRSRANSRSRDTNQPEGVLMRVLLSTIGSRGDVQPLVALATGADGARAGGAAVRAARFP